MRVALAPAEPDSCADQRRPEHHRRAHLIAELQGVTLAIRLFGLDALPHVLARPVHAANMDEGATTPNRTIPANVRRTAP